MTERLDAIADLEHRLVELARQRDSHKIGSQTYATLDDRHRELDEQRMLLWAQATDRELIALEFVRR